MLKLTGIKAGYDDLEILHGIDLSLGKGQILAVIGSNGSGKTTMMKVICGLIKPFAGTIQLEGCDITGYPAHKVSDLGIAYVPEGKRLFGRLSVIDNLLVGSYMKRTRAEREKNLEFIFGLFPILSERRNQRAGTLSGGEQQMLAIARGLMMCPQLILFDEPSLGIAPVIVDRIFGIIPKLRNMGLTVLISEQNVRRALQIADFGMVIQTGRIVIEGKSEELLQSDMIKNAYLGM